MKKHVKRMISAILVFCLLITAVPLTGFVGLKWFPLFAFAATSGRCGDNLTWSLNSSGTLTISGTGDMQDFNSSDAPWFSSGISVKSAVIQAGVTSIGMNAFSKCSTLTSVSIPDSVTYIGHSAFYGCTGLSSITLPDSIESMGDFVFNECSGLKTVKLPKSISRISQTAFADCTSLTSVTIPEGVTVIGPAAFMDCTGLTQITLPASVKSIQYSAFERCSGLKSIKLPDGVTYLGLWAFCGCSELTSITIPVSVTEIGQAAFLGCDKLTDIYYSGSIEQWNAIDIAEDANERLQTAKLHHDFDDASYIQFGTYPQTRVTDTDLISKLSAVPKTWKSYNYYSGTEYIQNASDYMSFADFFFGENKYRAVSFTSYRPEYTGMQCSAEESNQDENGYTPNTIYYFLYEPISWRVLDPNEGLILSEMILDSQAYQNMCYYSSNNHEHWQDASISKFASDYATSSIRDWLNYEFYETAFTDSQKNSIRNDVTLNNDCPLPDVRGYDSAATKDRVFLLSYNEVNNTAYGISDKNDRNAQGTDYAKAQGLCVFTLYNPSYTNLWWLRSPYYSGGACCILGDGNHSFASVANTGTGVRVACRLSNLKSDTSQAQTLFSEVAGEKGIVVYSTEHNMSIQPGESMTLLAWLGNTDEVDEQWNKMTLSVSDPKIINVSAYTKTNGMYKFDVTGKKEGSTNIVITDADSGISTKLTVTVTDNYKKTYSFHIEDDRVPSFTREGLETNFYVNGMYVNNYHCKKTSTGYKVSFDAYNCSYHIGAVDIYNKEGEWINCKAIDKFEDPTSVYETGEKLYYQVSDLFSGKGKGYDSPILSTHSFVEFDVPEDGFFTISNNAAFSIGTFIFNGVDLCFDILQAGTDIIASSSPKVDYDAISQYFSEMIRDNPSLKKELISAFTNTVTDGVIEISKVISADALQYIQKVPETAKSYTNLFSNYLSSIKEDLTWKSLLSVGCGVAESVFAAYTGPFGVALEEMFTFTKYGSVLMKVTDLIQSVDEFDVSVYSDPSVECNNHGFAMFNNGNVTDETQLQVFRVADDETIRIILNASPEEQEKLYGELYNICLVLNDQLVQPNGKVQIKMPIPPSLKGDTCSVYRQETDGTWTMLTAKVQNGYLVFETDHFSLYGVTGEKSALSLHSLPSKTDYYEGQPIDLSGMVLLKDGVPVDTGYLIEPTAAGTAGKQTVTVKYGVLKTSFTVNVKKCSHSWGNWATVKSSENLSYITVQTCNYCTQQYRTCTVCGKIDAKEEKSASHNWKDPRAEDPVCTVCGYRLSELKAMEHPYYISGDVDNDGNVTAADARLALRRAVDLETYPEGSAEYLACDVDKDGKVTASDARIILRVAVGLETL